MAFDFPSSGLSIGQIVTGPNGTSYTWDGVKWTAAVSGSNFLPIGGGSLTGPLDITGVVPGGNVTYAFSMAVDAPANNASMIRLNGQAGANKGVMFETAGNYRWLTCAESNPESGSNQGSDLGLFSYPDTGNTAVKRLEVNRASGNIAINMNGGSLIQQLPAGSWPQIMQSKGSATDGNNIIGQLNAVNRWSLSLGNTNNETGSNVGSDFGIYNYADNGSYLGQVMGIARSTGITTFGYNVNGGSYTSNGSNAGIYFNSRSGSGDQYCIYNPGDGLHFWDSANGDMGVMTSGRFTYNNGLTIANAPQLRMTPQVGANSYGSMWYNDGSNTYLLLTNNNDALGSWNGLRPIYIQDSNGYVSMNQGVSITGGLTADNIQDRGWGISYSAYAGNQIAFQWTGSCQLFVDNNNNGTLITSSNWTSYIPNANNNPAGCVLRSGDTMSGRLTVPTITQSGIGIIYSQYNGTNNVAFKWGGGLQEYIDGTYQGTIQASCDARTKYNRAPPEIHDPLGDLLKINLESFDQELLKGDPLKHVPIGFIAQNLQAIGEDMVDVGYVHDDETGEETDETRLAVAMLPMFARLVGAVQQQNEKILELEARLAALEARPSPLH